MKTFEPFPRGNAIWNSICLWRFLTLFLLSKMDGYWISLTIATFLGSSLGGLCRYLLSGWIAQRFGERFPVGVMAVNVSGAFLIGIVWSMPWGDWAPGFEITRDFLMFGFLGGYTTVSSFTLNTLNLFQEGEWRAGLLNLLGSYFLCLFAVFAGVFIIRII